MQCINYIYIHVCMYVFYIYVCSIYITYCLFVFLNCHKTVNGRRQTSYQLLSGSGSGSGLATCPLPIVCVLS